MRSRAKTFTIFIVMAVAITQVYPPLIRAEMEGRLYLDIEEVSRLALKNNFDIQVYKLDSSISEKELLKARAVYDTEIDASYEYDENRLKRGSSILGTKITTVTQDVSVTKELPTGTVLSLGFSHEREASDSAFSAFPASHESEVNASLTQPLAKNAWGIEDRNDIKITKLDIENTGYTSMDKIEQELASVQKAYWNLLLANRRLDVTEELFESARQLYATTKKKFDIGLVEQPEFYAVAANLKEREGDVLLAKDNVNAASNLMTFKLNLDKDIVVVPRNELDGEESIGAFEDKIGIALARRRDYASAKNDVKMQDLYIEMKKSSMWPQIDLTGTFKRNGLDQKFSASIREINSQDFPEYIVGVVFSFPLENSTARAEYSQKELEKAKALVNLKKAECLILVEVHDAFIHAKSLHDSVQLLQQAMEFQQKKYEGEENRFEKGRSDTDRLIRYQNDYLNARLKHLQGLYDYKAALIDLELAMNTLLEEEL